MTPPMISSRVISRDARAFIKVTPRGKRFFFLSSFLPFNCSLIRASRSLECRTRLINESTRKRVFCSVPGRGRTRSGRRCSGATRRAISLLHVACAPLSSVVQRPFGIFLEIDAALGMWAGFAHRNRTPNNGASRGHRRRLEIETAY